MRVVTAVLLLSPIFTFVAAGAESGPVDFKDKVAIAQMRGVPVKWDIDANLATFVAQATAAGAVKVRRPETIPRSRARR